MMAEAPAEKKEAPLSYEEAVQIAKDAGMSSSDIARCQRLAALSQDEFEAELVQIDTGPKSLGAWLRRPKRSARPSRPAACWTSLVRGN
jgi:hypothetical protein